MAFGTVFAASFAGSLIGFDRCSYSRVRGVAFVGQSHLDWVFAVAAAAACV
jgi:hypothetical protein